jgi:hypothetical protein
LADNLVRLILQKVLTLESHDRASVSGEQTGYGTQRRTFTGTISPDNADDLALVYGEINGMESPYLTIGDMQIFYFQLHQWMSSLPR